MMDVRVNGYSLQNILTAAPKISDPVSAVCRTLELQVQKVDSLESFMGQQIELWYNDMRWFVGFLMKESGNAAGNLTYTAYDPCYFMKRCPDDWYFKNMTATQCFKTLAERSGVRVYNLANTGAVFPHLYYPAAEADKVAVDLIARTKKANSKRFWYRYKPDAGADGLQLFERKVPAEVWAFQVGVNLLDATYEKSVEEVATVVKLVNRETGKVVKIADAATLKKYGQLVHFEEVDKDQAKTMEKRAKDLLAQLKQISTTMTAEGINPDKTIPQLWSADVIYVEEPVTGIIGGYYIRNVTQSFEAENLVRLSFDIQAAPDVPELQYADASTATADKSATKGAKAAAKKKKTAADAKKGVQQTYSPELKKVMDQYGIE